MQTYRKELGKIIWHLKKKYFIFSRSLTKRNSKQSRSGCTSTKEVRTWFILVIASSSSNPRRLIVGRRSQPFLNKPSNILNYDPFQRTVPQRNFAPAARPDKDMESTFWA